MLLNCITFHTMGNRRQSLDRHPCVIGARQASLCNHLVQQVCLPSLSRYRRRLCFPLDGIFRADSRGAEFFFVL